MQITLTDQERQQVVAALKVWQDPIGSMRGDIPQIRELNPTQLKRLIKQLENASSSESERRRSPSE